ncbi:MAG: bifunctional UDP-sugar hydrolase/5'-nucleotidase [Synergistaceae bacterium]|nr:bifunctional UDP-sugar hydrolase/5'-nucleotidase [Synergistaceae bacterium]
MTFTKKFQHTFKTLLVSFVLLVCFCSSSIAAETVAEILFTHDTHCHYSENIGFAGVAAIKKDLQSKNPNRKLFLIDLGDAIQGTAYGVFSFGEYSVDIMNLLHYDIAILGNHAFDYLFPALVKAVKRSNTKHWLVANLVYTGPGKNPLSMIKPFTIETVNYGKGKKMKIGFVGVTTPKSITDGNPRYFMQDGKFVWSLWGRGAAQDRFTFYESIQQAINSCRKAGAEMVILLTHLGTDENFAPYQSVDLVHNVTGADLVLDSHSHSVLPRREEKDKSGKIVPITSTGCWLENVGHVTIYDDKTAATELINKKDVTKDGKVVRDEAIQKKIDAIVGQMDKLLSRKVGESEVTMTRLNEKGERLSKVAEIPFGNFCADAARYVAGAQIGLMNGGGMKAKIKKGQLTEKDLFELYPAVGFLAKIEVTGQQLLDLLEFAYSKTDKYENLHFDPKSKEPSEENGAFMHVSGLKVVVDSSIPTPVIIENSLFKAIKGKRRVVSVKLVTDDGKEVPIDPKKTYTAAGNSFGLVSGGDGNTITENCKLLNTISNDHYFKTYVKYVENFLHGKVSASKYSKPEGRIIVK